MAVMIILVVSIAVQLAAAMIAFRLTRITGRTVSWLLIASALLLMTIRRSITFLRLICGDLSTPLDLWAEIVALITSGLMLGGVGWIAPLFLTRERAQMETEGQYRFLVEHAGDVISRLTPSGRYSYVSPACRSVYGFEPGEMIRKSVYDFLPTAQSDQFRSILESSKESHVPIRVEHSHLGKDGEHAPISSTLSPVWDDERGEVSEIICVSRGRSFGTREST